MTNIVYTRKNFPDAHKLSCRQCRHADKVFGTLATCTNTSGWAHHQINLNWLPSHQAVHNMPDDSPISSPRTQLEPWAQRSLKELCILTTEQTLPPSSVSSLTRSFPPLPPPPHLLTSVGRQRSKIPLPSCRCWLGVNLRRARGRHPVYTPWTKTSQSWLPPSRRRSSNRGWRWQFRPSMYILFVLFLLPGQGRNTDRYRLVVPTKKNFTEEKERSPMRFVERSRVQQGSLNATWYP